MAASVALDSVTTTDAAPTTAPHRISAISGEDSASVKFTPSHNGTLYPGPYLLPDPLLLPGGAQRFRAWRLRMGGIDRNTGLLLDKAGRICGEPCGADPCSDYSVASATQITDAIDYAETGAPGDGDYTVNIYAKPVGEDWA